MAGKGRYGGRREQVNVVKLGMQNEDGTDEETQKKKKGNRRGRERKTEEGEVEGERKVGMCESG